MAFPATAVVVAKTGGGMHRVDCCSVPDRDPKMGGVPRKLQQKVCWQAPPQAVTILAGQSAQLLSEPNGNQIAVALPGTPNYQHFDPHWQQAPAAAR